MTLDHRTLVTRVALGGALLAASLVGLPSCGSGDGSGDGNGGDQTSSGSTSSTDGSGAGINAGDGGSGIGNTGGNSLGQGGENNVPDESECGDGIDNDGDGHTDYALDPGCYGPWDATEAAGSRDDEGGFTTFDFEDDTVVIYVSADGDDSNDGTTPETSVATIEHAATLVRDGEHDFIRLRRGDTWRDPNLGRFLSGRDATHPLVLGSYGESLELPRIEVGQAFINHDGARKDYFALMDLHIVAYKKDPSDPEFDGASNGSLRLVGSGNSILVEGCHFEYAEIILQSYGEGVYDDTEIRANVFEKAYHVDTCVEGDPNGNSDHRPSGIYASHVNRLLVEGNVFDHNGWNEDVDSACATIYNHNVYLNGNNVVIRDNVFARASSIHVKMVSEGANEGTGTRVLGNYFVEGEIGVSLGGNSSQPLRFVDSEVADNVFSDIGRSDPTGRGLAWAVDIVDNEGTLVSDNLILNQHTPGVDNSYGIRISSSSAHDVKVRDNTFYRITYQSLVNDVSDDHEAIDVSGNTFVDPELSSRLIVQNGSFSAYTYSSNRYYSSAPADTWFSPTGTSGRTDVEGWVAASGETDAEELSAPPNYVDPERSIETYAQSLELGSTLEEFMGHAVQQTRLRWYYELSAPAINGYIKAGFEEN